MGLPGDRDGAGGPIRSATHEPRSDLTISGVVREASLSARVIVLEEPAEGNSTIAIVDEPDLRSSDGRPLRLNVVLPGMTVQASGPPGAVGTLLADRVTLLRAWSQ